MIIELQLWHFISLLLSFFACVAGFWKLTEARREKAAEQRWADAYRHMDTRFDLVQKNHLSIEEHMETRFELVQKNRTGIDELERNFLRFQAHLPLEYVRREDYVRGQSVIEAKLDALYHKIELLQLRGYRGNRGNNNDD